MDENWLGNDVPYSNSLLVGILSTQNKNKFVLHHIKITTKTTNYI